MAVSLLHRVVRGRALYRYESIYLKLRVSKFFRPNVAVSSQQHWRGYSSTSDPVPSSAKVVVCGGGVIGTSVAYHLADKGWTNVILLEQGK